MWKRKFDIHIFSMLLGYGINNGIMEYVIIWKSNSNFLKFRFYVSLKTLRILQGHSSVCELLAVSTSYVQTKWVICCLRFNATSSFTCATSRNWLLSFSFNIAQIVLQPLFVLLQFTCLLISWSFKKNKNVILWLG